ncbi:hypothetical protein [Sulfolobus tengchongensis spindle-shaped virus 3]|nr:hypothetical protein [Sulfolobus tengchongensis spindle-shaped virus 3]
MITRGMFFKAQNRASKTKSLYPSVISASTSLQ